MERGALVEKLIGIVGRQYVLVHPEDVVVYEQDGSILTATPEIVVLPGSTEEVASVVKIAREAGIPVIPRGSGTGLAGGAVPVEGGIVVSLTRMNRILDVDLKNRLAIVEPGVINLDVTKATAPLGFFYAPDPSSQAACSLGGNVANNSGGPHTPLYGVTTNHVLAVEVVLDDGEVVWLHSTATDTPGYDLAGLLVGSEGTLGIVTKIVVRLLPLRESVRTLLAIFDRMDDATRAVTEITAAGIIPASLEMMDQVAIRAVEKGAPCGYPLDAEAVLLVEVEGVAEHVDRSMALVEEICRNCQARELRLARDEAERQLLWKGRKGAFGAMGALAPNYFVQDGVVPRSRLLEIMRRVREISERHGVLVANVFHAGDGNLHPNLLFDIRKPGELERVRQASAEILRACVEVGGSLTGEHGIGVEKKEFMHWLFSEEDLEAMAKVKRAFDPLNRFNPAKVFPSPPSCGEAAVAPHKIPAGLWV
jgi:glycolate oxidase